MSIRDAKLHLNNQRLNVTQENFDHIKNLLDEGKIVPNAVLMADHIELLDIIRRHPLPRILCRETAGTFFPFIQSV